MKLHLGALGDNAQPTITIEHVDPFRALTAEDLKKNKEHNQVMLEIASSLSYTKFDDIKECDTAKKIWDAIEKIYGGDRNVLRAKSESLRGKFDDMRMQEGENIVEYCARVKEVANVIKGSNGKIEDETMIRKLLRTLLPIHAIRVSSIQEQRYTPSNDLTLEGLIGRLIAFELSNFDNFKYDNVESSFQAKIPLKEPKEKKKKVFGKAVVMVPTFWQSLILK